MPDAESQARYDQLRSIHREVGLAERDFRIDRGRDLDLGFAEAAHDWCGGRPLAAVLADTALSAGDFVRWVRQVIDFADQIGKAAALAEDPALRRTCREVSDTMRRGVVAF